MFIKNNFFYKTLSLFILIISCLAISCTTNSEGDIQLNIEGQWKFQAFENLEINNINAAADPMLISTSEGIHLNEGTNFDEFGLKEKPIINVIQINEEEYIAAIETLQLEGGDTTLYKTNNGGEQWAPHMGNFGGEENKYTLIHDLIIKEQGSTTFFTCGGGNIARTEDRGASWISVHLTWEHLGGCLFVKTDPGNSDIIWSGGFNAVFDPTLNRSTDGGDTWEQLTVLENVETTAHDVAIHHQVSSRVMIGLGIGIRRSIDGGDTWNTAFNEAAIYTLTHSTLNPEIVYASGRNATGTLFFLSSGDFGDTWQTVEFENSPGEISVNDMVSVMEGGNEVLYLGTNKGLYSFTFDE